MADRGFNHRMERQPYLETYKTESGAPYEVQMSPNAFKIKYVEGGRYGDVMSTLSPAMKTAISKSMMILDINYENAVPVMASGKYGQKWAI